MVSSSEVPLVGALVLSFLSNDRRRPIIDDPLETCIRIAPPGFFAEFGVGNGTTLRKLAAVRYTVGFDSFEGLPEEWRDGFNVGHFKQDVIPLIHDCTLIIGPFADTCPKVVCPVALVHIDCDLYSSTVTALAWVKNNAKPGCLVVFDEFYGYPGCEEHEQKALAESGLEYEAFCRSTASGEKVAIRLK